MRNLNLSDEIVAWLVVLVPLTMAVIIGVSKQYKSMPAWFHEIAVAFQKFFRLLLYIGLAVFVLLVVLPWGLQEGAIWLFPNNAFGYTMKYDVSEKSVYVQPKPHDCEWGKAPIGNKYCHFDRVVSTDKDQTGKVTTVYVNWQRVEE